MVMLSSFPFLECRQLLGYSGEEAGNDTNGCGLHVIAKLAHNLLVLSEVSKAEKKSKERDEPTGMR